MNTLREIGYILWSVEHDTRMIRLDPDRPENRPYRILNRIGRAILRLTGRNEEYEE